LQLILPFIFCVVRPIGGLGVVCFCFCFKLVFFGLFVCVWFGFFIYIYIGLIFFQDRGWVPKYGIFLLYLYTPSNKRGYPETFDPDSIFVCFHDFGPQYPRLFGMRNVI